MKAQRTNSTFANSNPQADTSACKRAIFCLSLRKETKRTAPKMKQPFQLTNFCPFGAITPWTWRKRVRIIIKSDYFSTFYAFVAPLSRFFSSCVHKYKFKILKTSSRLKIEIEQLLATFFSRANFHFFSYCCRWPSCSLFFLDKLSCASISNSRRCFAHFNKNLINLYTIINITRKVTNAFRIV